jgi:hypothetical protein
VDGWSIQDHRVSDLSALAMSQLAANSDRFKKAQAGPAGNRKSAGAKATL